MAKKIMSSTMRNTMEVVASFSPIILALSLAIIMAFISHSLLKLFATNYSTPNYPNLPPGSMGYPFIGQTLSFLKPHHSNSIGIFLQHHSSRFGKVFKSHLFGSPTIVSCDRELNMFILQNEGKLFKVSYPKSMRGILGANSVLIVNGDAHRKFRNVAINFISWCKSKPSFFHFVDKLSVTFMDSLRCQNQVLFYKKLKMFSLSVVVKELFGIEANELIGSSISEGFEAYMKGFNSLPLNLPKTNYSNAIKARGRLSCIVKEMIRERRRKLIGGVEMEGTNENFLEEIMSNWKLDDEEIVSVVLDILLGSYETTSTLMGLIVYFLANSPPNILAKLKEEHETIRLGKRNGEHLNLEDYKQMKFTSNVILEALRCGNVVMLVPREALKDVKFKDIVIPSGWKVYTIFSAVHLDPALHPNPHQFNPWRWMDDKEMSKKVTPFGGGPRLCPGSEFSKIEIAFFFHHLVLNYRWKTRADECPLAYPYVRFKRDLLLEIEPC